MEEATWYLGPLGDMRALVCPEPGIEITPTRYGGTHQGLSGARIVDVTGHRTDYSFEFKHLLREEYAWYEALHHRLVPGPFYLLDPLKRNRLTVQSSRLLPAEQRGAGVDLTSAYTQSRDWPSEVDIPGRSLKLTAWTSPTVQFDTAKPVPLLPDETLTASVYLKSDTSYNGVKIRVAWYDQDKVFIRNDDSTVNISTYWDRYWFTYHEAPSNAAAALFTVVLGSATTSVYLAAPMLEAGVVWPSPWELGGGAPLVLLDQLPATSGRYPLRDVTLTLMEA